MKAEAAEEARRWEEEQEAEMRRKEAMKLTQEERDNILQVAETDSWMTLRGKLTDICRVCVLTGLS